jgi:hypothetical protein
MENPQDTDYLERRQQALRAERKEKRAGSFLIYTALALTWFGALDKLTYRPSRGDALKETVECFVDLGETIAERPSLFEQLIEKATTQPGTVEAGTIPLK